MIGTTEIDQIRAEAEELLPGTGRVLVHSQKSDGAGGQEEAYTPGPELPCAIAPAGRAGGAASTGGDRISEETTHYVTFPVDAEIRSVDRVETDGVTYAVTALRNYGEMSMTRRVEVMAL